MKNFFKKLFGEAEKKGTGTVAPGSVDTVSKEEKTVPRQAADSKITAPLSADAFSEYEQPLYPPQLVVGCAQSVGRQRDHNEDALFTLTSNIANDASYTTFGLYIIADGMGGHQHGEVASGTAVRAMANCIIRRLYAPLCGLDPQPPEESLQEILLAGANEAHQAIIRDAAGGGSTLTVALILGNQLMIAHVGDSRAYAIYPDGRFQTITRDHSLVKRLEELGQITSSEAASHPQRNVLYRALGQGEPFEPDVISFPMPLNGYLLLCSDGLWGVVSESEMRDIIQSKPTPHEACQALVETANLAGGPDNISVILIHTPG